MEELQKSDSQITSSSKQYYRCSKCNKVHDGSKWIRGEKGFICPACAGVNSELARFDFSFTLKDVMYLLSVKEELSDLKETEKELTARIKPILVQQGITEFNYEDYKLSVTYTDKGEVVDEKLIALIDRKIQDIEQKIADSQSNIEVDFLLKERDMLSAAIVIKRSTEPNVVKALVTSGKITLEELADCKTSNIVPTFTPKGLKKKKKIAEMDPPKFENQVLGTYNTVERKDML
jgi:hypothetical protein